MKKQDILSIIKNNKPELERRFGVENVGLFGSYVREQNTATSDIDIVVSYYRDIDRFEFVGLREYLEHILDARVDLVMQSALKPSIGKRILSEVEYA